MYVQGLTLEITVIACYKLKDTELFSRQDPYVCFDYGGFKYRTSTCTDGGKNPTFRDEKFQTTLVEGLRDINVSVWNSNTILPDYFIGSGRIRLDKVIAEGYDDTTWSLQTKTSRYAGDLKVIMHIKKPFQTQQVAPSNVPAAAYPNPTPPYAPPPPSNYHQPPAYPAAAPPMPAYPAASAPPQPVAEPRIIITGSTQNIVINHDK